MRTRFGLLAVVVVALTLSGCTDAAGPSVPSASPTAAGDGTGIAPGTQGTPLAVSLLTTPQAVHASDGRWHLAYELVMTDATPATLQVSRVEVLDAATQRVIDDVSGSQLKADLTPVAGPAGDEGVADPTVAAGTTTIAPSRTWIVWLDVSVPTRADVPAVLEHRVVGTAQVPAAGRSPVPFDAIVNRVATAAAAAVVLSPPVRAGDWYMSEGCCSDDTHHRRGIAPVNGVLQVPQRFAIDFYRLDSEDRTWVGDPSKLTSYLTYRQPIIAAAPGTIVARRDGIPNSTAVPEPPAKPPIDQTVGNFVIEQIGSGLFVLYAHMDPGSVKVKVGQKVARGQQLGLIGTSGNSTTPHLHFQVLTTPTFFPADSPPYAFDRFQLLGRVPDQIWDDNLGLQKTGTLPVVPASPGVTHTDELPLDRTVVRFG